MQKVVDNEKLLFPLIIHDLISLIAMPSVKELEAFVAVVESGSFQGAARRLNATPPAISKRISELESDLGVRLFERSTRRCHITPRGRAIVAYARRVLGDIGEIQRLIGKRSSLVGHIRLGVVETIAFTKLPELLQKFSIDLIKLTVDVEVGVTTELVRKVRTRELDIACVVAPVLEPDLVSEPFWEVEMSWIAPGARWSEKPLTIEALAQYPIMLQTGSRHIPVIEGWFKNNGLRVIRMITCNSLSAAVKMTAAGLGLSLVPIECARQELDAGAVTTVPVQVQLPANSFVTIYPTGQIEPALGAVIDVIRELAAGLLNERSKSLRGKAERR
jgi:DNA-binding transcriptional LysR family regulator